MNSFFRKLIVVLLVLQVFLGGCTNTKANQQATADAVSQAETADAMQTANAQAVQATAAQATAAQITSVAATDSALATLNAAATLSAQETDAAIADITATADAHILETENAANVTATARIAARLTATQEAISKATAQAQPLYDMVQKLNQDGTITRNQGVYHPIFDFDESWAQRDWYSYWPTGYRPDNFIIDADAWWQAADKYAEASGCGFVFRESAQGDNHYLIFYSIEGHVMFLKYVKGVYTFLKDKEFDRQYVQERSAHITLVVEDNWITTYIDHKQALRIQENSLTSGNLYLTLVSGTNKDFGTRCKMTNIGLWVLR